MAELKLTWYGSSVQSHNNARQWLARQVSQDMQTAIVGLSHNLGLGVRLHDLRVEVSGQHRPGAQVDFDLQFSANVPIAQEDIDNSRLQAAVIGLIKNLQASFDRQDELCAQGEVKRFKATVILGPSQFASVEVDINQRRVTKADGLPLQGKRLQDL